MTAALAWGLLLVDRLLAAEEKPTNFEGTHEELLKWCAKECAEAVPYLDERESTSDKDGAVKVTKGFAWAVQGKALLNAGDNAGAKAALKMSSPRVSMNLYLEKNLGTSSIFPVMAMKKKCSS